MTKSLTFYNFNDDHTIKNYMALLAYIINPNLTHSRAVKIFSLNSEGYKRNNLYCENTYEDKPKNR